MEISVNKSVAQQVIVIRKDLSMRKGKMCAQASHASMKVILDSMVISPSLLPGIHEKTLFIQENTALIDWLEGKFTKICVSVDSESELLDIYNKAFNSKLPCSLIRDAGLTEFGGVPTLTCCAIGPAWSAEIDSITGHLKLL